MLFFITHVAMGCSVIKISAVKLKSISQFKCICLFVLLLIVDARSKITKGPATENIFSESRNTISVDGFRWSKGIINYYLDNLSYDSFIAQRLRMVMNAIESASCVMFKPILLKPLEGNINWIHFTNPQGERNCVHQPTYNKSGEIILTLGLDCLKEREILHTLLHAIGFKDEVTHPQRDQYIRVLWNNIHPEYRRLYRIQQSSTDMPLVEYDPLSVMHFHDRAFSMNGRATVMPLVSGLLINPSNDLSQLDKMKLRILFDRECNKRNVGDMIDSCKMVMTNGTKAKDKLVEDDNKNNNSTILDSVEEEENQAENNEPENETELSDGGEIKVPSKMRHKEDSGDDLGSSDSIRSSGVLDNSGSQSDDLS